MSKFKLKLPAFMIVLLFSAATMAQEWTHYEAIVRLGDGSEHVTTTAKDGFTARRQIELLYCGGGSCIIEGPWPIPGK